MKYDRWPTRQERQRLLEEIADAGGVFNWLKRAGEKKPLSAKERARKAAANAVADQYGFPRPYADLDAHPHKEDGQ